MIGRMMAREGTEMNALILICGNVFDGISDALTGPAEILVENNRIAKIARSVHIGIDDFAAGEYTGQRITSATNQSVARHRFVCPKALHRDTRIGAW
jgi:hypothetical protein